MNCEILKLLNDEPQKITGFSFSRPNSLFTEYIVKDS